MNNKTIEVTTGTNAQFFAAHAKPGCVGLVGGNDPLNKLIRRAQRRQTADKISSLYSHAFLFGPIREDGQQWVLESDLDIHRERAQLGVQENRAEKYFSDKAYPHVAILNFGINEKQFKTMYAEGLHLLANRTQYSLREITALFFKLKTPNKRAKPNALAQDDAFFCSALVQHLYLQIGIDFQDAVDTKLTTLEDIVQTPVKHVAYVKNHIGK
jgi:hypothetical protein